MNQAARPQSAQPGRFEELESIRGLAALLVVFFHLPKWNAMLDTGFINNGYLMVELFFVLSGFVIFNAYAERIEVTGDLIRFQFLRFWRLYPVHVLFLLVYLAFETVKYLASTKLGIDSPNSAPFKTNNLSAFVKNLLLVSSVLPNQPLTYNFPSWSISVEFYTYLVFSLTVFFFRENKTLAFLALGSSSLLMLIADATYGFHPLIRCFAGFSIGCLTARFTRDVKIHLPGFVALVVFLVTALFLQVKTAGDCDWLMYFLASALIASLVVSSGGLLKRILNWHVMTWLGAVSYSIYMSHAAVGWVANQTIRFVFKKPELVGENGISVPQLTQIETLLASSLVIVGVLLVSAFVHNAIEKPIRERSRRFAHGMV